MNIGISKLAEQVDGSGFYGVIELECKTSTDDGRIDLSMHPEFEKWRPAILFGATFFLEHYLFRKGVSVKITKIESHEVDTSSVIIAFLTFNAIIDALKIPCTSKIEFNQKAKQFIFPK